MSTAPNVPHPTPPPTSLAPKEAGHRLPSWTVITVVGVVMILLALVGIGLAMASNAKTAETYWIALVPVYGVLCILTAWYRHGTTNMAVLRQVLHWVVIGVALGLDYTYIRGTGEQTGQSAGLTSLLLLAVGCFLAGVHVEWLFALAGGMLTVILIVLAVGEQYLPMIFGIGIAVIVIMIGARFLLRPRTQTVPSAPAAPAR